jgi:hypothetical protein
MCFQALQLTQDSQTQPFGVWPHLSDLKLADPDSSSQHPIHLLIGSNLFSSILVRESPRLGPTDAPVAQKTVFDWIISGPTGIAPHDIDQAHVSLCIAECDTNSLLRKF